MNTYDIEIDDCPTTESIRARNAKNALRTAAEVVRKGDWNADNIEFCVVNQVNREDMECGEVQIGKRKKRAAKKAAKMAKAQANGN